MVKYGKSFTGSTDVEIKKISGIEYRYIYKNYSFLLELDKNIKILEVGPGFSYFTQFLLENGFTNIDLVELSLDFSEAQQKAFSDFSGVNVYNIDIIEFLKNNNNKYDLIISRQVVEHINGNLLNTYFNETSKIINNGGMILSETINAQNIIYGNFLRYGDFTHTVSFSTNMINQFYNSYYSKGYTQKIKGVSHINTLDYILDKIKPTQLNIKIENSNVKLDDTDKNNKIYKVFMNLFTSLISELLRDFIRMLSVLITLIFFYKKAYKNIGTEFILFIFKKGEK